MPKQVDDSRKRDRRYTRRSSGGVEHDRSDQSLGFPNEVFGRQADIEKEHEKQVKEAVRKLPIPSQICGDRELVTMASTTENPQPEDSQ